MEIRPPKETDQEQTEKAFELVKDLIISHPEVEPSLWVGALLSAVAHLHYISNISFKEFRSECDRMVEHYKINWEWE